MCKTKSIPFLCLVFLLFPFYTQAVDSRVRVDVSNTNYEMTPSTQKLSLLEGSTIRPRMLDYTVLYELRPSSFSFGIGAGYTGICGNITSGILCISGSKTPSNHSADNVTAEFQTFGDGFHGAVEVGIALEPFDRSEIIIGRGYKMGYLQMTIIKDVKSKFTGVKLYDENESIKYLEYEKKYTFVRWSFQLSKKLLLGISAGRMDS